MAGETLTSFLGRLAAVNRTSPDALLDTLPHWFRVKARWHDDRWQPSRLVPWADDAAARLAVISGSTTAAIKAALPAFGGKRGRPLRAAIACRLCTAARGIQQQVPVHLPAYQQLCIRHGIWLPGPETPQFSVSGCPGIPDAERRARRLLRHCTAEQLIYSRTQAPADANDQAWKRRMMALIESNPRSAVESSSQELFLAAAYPDAIAAACSQPQKLAVSNLHWQKPSPPPDKNRQTGHCVSRGSTIQIPLLRSATCTAESSLSRDTRRCGGSHLDGCPAAGTVRGVGDRLAEPAARRAEPHLGRGPGPLPQRLAQGHVHGSCCSV